MMSVENNICSVQLEEFLKMCYCRLEFRNGPGPCFSFLCGPLKKFMFLLERKKLSYFQAGEKKKRTKGGTFLQATM